MNLPTIIANLRTTLASIEGLVRVYDDPPESINEFPSAIVWAGSGELNIVSEGLARDFHTILIQIYQSRQVLPEAMDVVKVWPELVRAAIHADHTLGGSIAHYVQPIRYRSSPLRYGSTEHFGVSFELQVKYEGSYE